MTELAFYLLVFLAVGAFFLFIHLLMGSVIRPNKPEEDKLTIYECGEPTVGSAWVQFDLRYYVVALLFVVFDVEVAFFFPWAVVFGTANSIEHALTGSASEMRTRLASYYDEDLAVGRIDTARHEQELKRLASAPDDSLRQELSRSAYAYELKPVNLPGLPGQSDAVTAEDLRTLAWVAFGDIMVFFGVLMMGFAYLWRRGDIDWVRAVAPPPVVTRELGAAADAPRTDVPADAAQQLA